jgi:hypothetical protein
MFRFHDDQDGINNNADSAEAASAKPQNASPDFSFVKTVQTQVSEQNTEGKSNPLVVFASSGHKDSLFFYKYNLEKMQPRLQTILLLFLL